MPKAILIILLTVVSSSAMAEWVKVSEDKLVTAYADPTTIRKLGDKVKMWALWCRMWYEAFMLSLSPLSTPLHRDLRRMEHPLHMKTSG